jgi:leucyl aminopeptidase
MTINASRTVKKVFSTFDSLLKSSPFKFNGIVVSYKKGDPFNLFEDEVTNKLVRDSFKCNTAHLLFPSSLPPIVLACNDGTSESVRNISSMAIKQLKSLIVSEKMMEENNILGVLETSERKNNIKALSEGCNLGLYDIKTKISSHSPLFDPAKQRNTVSLQLLQGDDDQEYQWEVGRIFASCQNISRYLMDMPSNMMTPSIFAYEAEKYFGNRRNTILKVFGKEWAKEQKMGAFLGVSAGSEEPLKFVEIHYKGKVETDDVDVSLVGKGITFDSGGISIKPSAGMGSMKVNNIYFFSYIREIWVVQRVFLVL